MQWIGCDSFLKVGAKEAHIDTQYSTSGFNHRRVGRSQAQFIQVIYSRIKPLFLLLGALLLLGGLLLGRLLSRLLLGGLLLGRPANRKRVKIIFLARCEVLSRKEM